jgi:hypothetical protein
MEFNSQLNLDRLLANLMVAEDGLTPGLKSSKLIPLEHSLAWNYTQAFPWLLPR